MEVKEKTLRILEFDKILGRLAKHASFSASESLARTLAPSNDLDEVKRWQKLTSEARRLLNLRPGFSVGEAKDVREAVYRASIGGTLEPADLLDIRDTLVAARTVRNSINRGEEQLELLSELAALLVDCPRVEQEVSGALNDQGEIVDSASPTLRRLRAELKVSHQRLVQTLDSLINSATYRPMIQDPIVTVRDGRYVVPVKAEFKGQIKGIVHDQSASGATLFIEPMATVDLNNRLRELQLEEEREIARILRELSVSVAAHADSIRQNVSVLAEIDLALAKARFANEMKAVEPILVEKSKPWNAQAAGLRLVNARHPLLTGRVVPITVTLGNGFHVLVITGPNTGGKTVALKTVGLLTLMAQAGLHIPADEGSQIVLFDVVYADIGDEQSIEQSLSTFSSHMTNVIEILREAGAGSLVLLDEVGAGTDPEEGSALARALLSYFVEHDVATIATTHYSELKAFAHATAGVENASVEFDVETLAPTYKLSIGIPGRSNALAIASRLGLPESILEAARQHTKPTEAQVDSLLRAIQEEREKAAADLAAAEAARRDAEILRGRLNSRLAAIERERAEVLRQAHLEGEAALTEVRERLRAIMDALERPQVSAAEVRAAVPLVRQVEKDLAQRQASLPQLPREEEAALGGPLSVGGNVLVRNLSQIGVLVGLPDERGEAEVQLGSFRVRVPVSQLQAVSRRETERVRQTSTSNISAYRSAPSVQLDMRGWRVEQVLPKLDQYIDQAYLAGLPYVRIVHGKGTGALRQAVRDFLRNHPLVESYQSAEAQEGGEGVTVAVLAD